MSFDFEIHPFSSHFSSIVEISQYSVLWHHGMQIADTSLPCDLFVNRGYILGPNYQGHIECIMHKNINMEYTAHLEKLCEIMMTFKVMGMLYSLIGLYIERNEIEIVYVGIAKKSF